MKKILMLYAAMCSLLFISCKPDADVEKWFESGTTVSLSFSDCDIQDYELWDLIGVTPSSSYLFEYDKVGHTGRIFSGGNYFQMDGMTYNKFLSEKTSLILDNVGHDNNKTRVEIIPSGKKYYMRLSIIPYRWGSWECVAIFSQEKR